MGAFRLFLICFLLLGLGSSPLLADSPSHQDMQKMMSWFTGRFDNHLQVWMEKGDEVAEELMHEHIHSIFAPVDLPAFGDNVFYVEQYMDGDPTKIYRQRIYVFSHDTKEEAVKLEIYAPLDAKAVAGAHLNPEKLKDLTPENTRATPGCEVYWRREGDHFVGSMKEDACRIKSRRSGKTLIISDDLYLDEDEIWISDRAVDTEGNHVFGHKEGIPHKLNKVQAFTGWAALRNEDKTYKGIRGLEIHDQGQRVLLKDEDGTSLGYEISLSQLLYMGKTPILKLGIHKEGETKTEAYAWANPGATRIGLNLGWLQVGLSKPQPEKQ